MTLNASTAELTVHFSGTWVYLLNSNSSSTKIVPCTEEPQSTYLGPQMSLFKLESVRIVAHWSRQLGTSNRPTKRLQVNYLRKVSKSNIRQIL